MSVWGVGTLANYHNLDQVGEGTYGYVYKASDKRNGNSVALKRMVLHKEHLGFPLCAIREIKFLKSLKHKNIVSLLDIASSQGVEHLDVAIRQDSKNKMILDQKREKEKMEAEKDEETRRKFKERDETLNMLSRCGSLYLVFEYIEHDLGGLIDHKHEFSQVAIKCIMKQLFDVLDHLADQRILHRDIKSSNILISDRHQVR